MKSEKIRLLVLILAIVVAYADTLTLHYASDDRMIIFENDYTLKGFKGIPEVMTKDAFTGFFGDSKTLVAGGRYRPLSQITFILEYELFGGSIHDKVGFHQCPENEQLFSDSILPVMQHGGNLILFILLCLSIYAVLKMLFPKFENEKWYFSVPFLATLLFALHPLHTEAVANIKGRDEIMSMLGAMLALYASLRFVSDRKWWWLLLSFAAMLFGIFSKENAITFLAVVPLSLWFVEAPKKKGDYLLTLLPLVVATGLFLAARTHALGGMMNQSTSDLILNNPFVHSTKAQTVATVILTWGIYLRLMLFPHPLTHDYYPHQIEITNFANPVVWFVTGCQCHQCPDADGGHADHLHRGVAGFHGRRYQNHHRLRDHQVPFCHHQGKEQNRIQQENHPVLIGGQVLLHCCHVLGFHLHNRGDTGAFGTAGSVEEHHL